MTSLYTFLGKTLGLLLIGDVAYEEAKTNGAGSLLEPQNFAALLAAAEGVLVPAPAVTATPAPTPISVAPAA
jgi:hypothetical protein